MGKHQRKMDQVPMSESIIKQVHYLVLADKKENRGV